MAATNKEEKGVIFFIFGGSGDLNHRKLMPALFNLYLDEYMPKDFTIVSLGRTSYTDLKFKNYLLQGIKDFSRRKFNEQIASQWKIFSKHLQYLSMDAENKKEYLKLPAIIQQKEKEWKAKANVIFYFAVAPQLVPDIARNLGKLPICKDCSSTRIVVEKPFGHDLQSAHELNVLLTKIFKEEQIYRIDHYLGKETVQNILAFRFANAMFEPIWNRNYIDYVQITNAETVGVGSRGDYYERSGALRDMIQNHMLQLICMIAMEAPVSFDANEIRNKKVDVLNAIKKISKEEAQNFAVRGQYDSGWQKGKKVKAYREEEKVDPNSSVETFTAIKFLIDNWRWEGVPFYVRTGKYLQEKTTVITIQFKKAPDYAFPPEASDTWRSNRLTISIQPEMDIRIRFQAKRPGQDVTLNPVNMKFSYADSYNTSEPEAYETLLFDVIEGDATLFMRNDQVEAAWKILMPIIEAWEARPPVDFPNYAPGSWGPEDAEALIAKDGFTWVNLPNHDD